MFVCLFPMALQHYERVGPSAAAVRWRWGGLWMELFCLLRTALPPWCWGEVDGLGHPKQCIFSGRRDAWTVLGRLWLYNAPCLPGQNGCIIVPVRWLAKACFYKRRHSLDQALLAQGHDDGPGKQTLSVPVPHIYWRESKAAFLLCHVSPFLIISF